MVDEELRNSHPSVRQGRALDPLQDRSSLGFLHNQPPLCPTYYSDSYSVPDAILHYYVLCIFDARAKQVAQRAYASMARKVRPGTLNARKLISS